MNLIETLRQLEAKRPTDCPRCEVRLEGDEIDDLLPRLLDLCEKQHEALDEYGQHQTGCTLAYFRSYRPELGWNFDGQWYKDHKTIPCTCGLNAALALYSQEIEP